MAMAIFFLLGLMVVGARPFEPENAGQVGILGGPGLIPEIQARTLSATVETGLLTGSPQVFDPSQPPELPETPGVSEIASEEGMLTGNGGPFGSVNGLLIYSVQKGDTLSRIAAEFGISVSTIIDSNPEVKNKALRIGQELQILPVSGVLYALKEGDTVRRVAGSFSLDPSQIQGANPSVDISRAAPGTTLIIPGASGQSSQTAKNLPNLKGYFKKPATGFNWAKLHPHNAVDIANSCGTEIVASAEGLVLAAEAEGWNGGYGVFVQMEHPNGTKTKYSHLSKLSVSVGDYLEQGQVLGEMGRTGEATGCHLHFEIEGAQNPFAK